MIEEAGGRLDAAGLAAQVEGLQRSDYTDLPHLPDGGFDVALCLGGSLNYMEGNAAVRRALGELRRLVRPGGQHTQAVDGGRAGTGVGTTAPAARALAPRFTSPARSTITSNTGGEGVLRRRISKDWQLQARMLVSMLLLALLYLVFADVLLHYAGAGFAIIVAGGLLIVQYYYSDRLVLYATGARMVTEQQEPRLHEIVTRLAQMADLPKPRVAVVPSPVPNAFATGRDPRHAIVAATQGLLQRLEPEELEAVMAHEMTHVIHRDMAVMTIASFFATIAAFITRNAFLFGWLGGFGGGFGGGYGGRQRDGEDSFLVVLIVSVAVWIISFFLINALSRYREYAADRGSAELTGSPSRLASALVKISGVMSRVPQRDLRQAEALNALFIIPAVRGGSWTELFATHPSLEHRLAHLRRLEAQMAAGPR